MGNTRQALLVVAVALVMQACASADLTPSKADLAYERQHPLDCVVIRAAMATEPGRLITDPTSTPPFTWAGFTETSIEDGAPPLTGQVRFLQAPDRALDGFAFCGHEAWNAFNRGPPAPAGQRFLVPRYSDDGMRALVGLKTIDGWRGYLLTREDDIWRVEARRILTPRPQPQPQPRPQQDPDLDPVTVDQVV